MQIINVVVISYAISPRYTSSEDQLYISGHYVRTPYHLFPNGQLPHSFKVARSVLEAGIRKWTLGYYPNVKQISGVVIGVIPTDDFSSNLTGVRIKSGDSHEINIPAALVIGKAALAFCRDTVLNLYRDRLHRCFAWRISLAIRSSNR